jgi:hypothetical protein
MCGPGCWPEGCAEVASCVLAGWLSATAHRDALCVRHFDLDAPGPVCESGSPGRGPVGPGCGGYRGAGDPGSGRKAAEWLDAVLHEETIECAAELMGERGEGAGDRREIVLREIVRIARFRSCSR